MKALQYLSLAVSVAILGGCSSKPGGAVEALKDSPPSINQLVELLRAGGGSGRPPSQLSDLEKHRKLFPTAYDAVKNGDIIVLWGSPPKGEGEIEKGGAQDVIAYEKDVPTAGGWVLLSGGTVKHMTAADFASAPKSKKS